MPLRPRLPLLGLALVVVSASTLVAGTLTALAPTGASSGITVQVSGTGFNATAAKNQVTLRAGLVVANVSATSATILDQATGRGRLLFVVPDGLPTGAAALEVKNLDTGETSAGRTLQVIGLSLPGLRRGARSATVDVTLTGTPNTVFVPGATRVVFGPGVTVTSVTVNSETEIVASVAIAADAALGPRAVAFNTSQQMAVLSGVFEVISEAPPTNRPPTANPGGPYAARVGQAVTFTGAASSDPDGDALTYAWDFGDGGTATGASPAHAFGQAATFTVTLTVSDGKGGSHTGATSVVVTETEPTNRPPTAEAGGPYAAMLNEPVVLNGSGSTDPDGDPLTCQWTFGDGGSGSGKVLTRAWTQAGTFTVTLTVGDGKGGSSSDTATVVITRPNHAPVVDAGPDLVVTLPDALPILGVVTDDGLPGGETTVAWSRVSGPAEVTFTPAGAAVTSASFAVAGTYVLRLTASDGERSAVDELAVTVRSPGDYTPPFVRLNAPREALPGARFTVTADAADNVAVVAVRFEVDGADPSDDAAPPYEREVEVPAYATPGQEIAVRATARDASGNTGGAQATTVVGVVPDTESPFVTLLAPAQAAPGTSIRFVAAATDNVGVARVVFLVDGSEAGSDPTPPYEAIFGVPAAAVIGSRLAVVARAADFNGNLAESAAATAVVGAADEEPPSVTLTAPPQVVAGASFDVSASVADNVGVAGVTFFVSGVPMATDEVPPYQARLASRADAVPGTMLPVVATAVDFANLMASDGRSILVTTATALPRGVVAGEVYDDTTGLPLGGAGVELYGTDERGVPFAVSAQSDGRGRYVLRAPAGVARLRITKAGWTRVNRGITLGLNVAVEAFDARLTPLKAVEVAISPTLGGTLEQGASQLLVPPGALASVQVMRVQSVSPQGLEGLLPYGWSPVAVVDILPHGVELAGGATLRAPPRFTSAANTTLVLAWWDESAARWRAVSATTAGAGTKTLEGLVTRTAQFAWLRPDVVPSAPPLPAPGAVVEGVTEPVLPDDLTTFINPQPRVLFYQPGVRSDVLGSITAIGPLSSGARLWARVSERYRFLDGAEATTDPFVEDLVFYQADAETTLAASYPVTPSLAFEAIALDAGVITVELYVPGEAPALALADIAGTVVQASTGESLVIPPGAVNEATPFALSGLDAAALGTALPEGLTLERAVQVQFAGTLAIPATLKVPTTLADASRVLLVKFETLGGATRLILVALAHVESGQLVSDVLLDGLPTGLSGVREAGRYAFVLVADPVGFAAGAVLGTSGAALPDALITSDGLGVASRSLQSGAYFAAARAGGAAFTARNLATGDAVTAGATIVARQVVPLTLTLVAQPPHVVSIVPADGAVNVPLSTPIVVVFSEPIDPATVGGANAGNLLLTGADGAPILGTVEVTHGNTRVTLRPAEPLAPNAAYTFTVAAAVTDAAGTPLGAPVTVRFTSLDTLPPPMPPAGSLGATIPNAVGRTTVTGTQGTASPHDQVFVLNTTRGTSTPVLVESDGGFSVVVPAGLADKLKLRIADPGGNETLVDLPRFRDPDGRTVIGPEGGQIEAANGLLLEIPEGAFPNGATVKFTWQPREVITAPDDPQFPFVTAFEIDASEAPAKYLNVSVPAPEGADPTALGVVAELVTIRGTPALNMVDTAKIVDGRLRTSSPPCSGILSKWARYAMYLSGKGQQDLAVALLSMTVDRIKQVTLKPTYLTVYMPPASVLIGQPIINWQLNPPLTRDVLYNPATNFISMVAGGDVIGGLAAAASDQRFRGFCMLSPADRPVRVVVRNANTTNIVAEIPVAPVPSGDVFAVDTSVLTPSEQEPPKVVWTSWSHLDPHVLDLDAPVQLVFSEPVQVVPVVVPPGERQQKEFFLREKDHPDTWVEGQIVQQDNNRTLIFLPDRALQMGRVYEVRMPGIADLRGNVFKDPDSGPLEFKTFIPYVLTPSADWPFDLAQISAQLAAHGAQVPSSGMTAALRDVDFISRPADGTATGHAQTTLAAIGRGMNNQFQMLTVDASNPRKPEAVGFGGPSNRYFQRLRAFRDISFDSRAPSSWSARTRVWVLDHPEEFICASTTSAAYHAWEARILEKYPRASFGYQPGCGDLAVTTSYNTYYAMAHFWDVTNPAAPAEIGERVLSDNGPQYGLPRYPKTPAAFGMARGVDVLAGIDITHDAEVNSKTAGAYVAVEDLGLVLADVGRNIPAIPRVLHGTTNERLGVYTFPFYQDVIVVRDKVVALASDKPGGSGVSHIEVFDAGLGQSLSMAPLPTPITAVASLLGLPYDGDGDGTPEPHDLLFVSGYSENVYVLELDPSGDLTQLGYYETPAAAGLRMRQIEADKAGRFAYVAASWTENGTSVSGLLMLDARLAPAGPVDADGDGWDDRIIGRAPITGPGQVVGAAEIFGLKVDTERQLAYLAVDGAVRGGGSIGLVIVKLRDRTDEEAKVALEKAVLEHPLETGLDFESEDSTTAVVFVKPEETLQRDLFLYFDVEVSQGVTLTYQLTEEPLSGDAADKLIDFTSTPTTGTYDPLQHYIRLALQPRQGLPAASSLYVDFTDEQGLLVKRAYVLLSPAFAVLTPTKLVTDVDLDDPVTCESSTYVRFYLSHEAKVSLFVDGFVLPRFENGQQVGDWQDVLLAPGENQVLFIRQMFPTPPGSSPGDHPVELHARFLDSPDVTYRTDNVVTHEIRMKEAFPIGQTVVKGVNVRGGALSLQREDFTIAGLGPNLSFARTYSTSGNASDGRMGAGWTHNWEAMLIRDLCGNVTIVGGEGTGTRFYPTGSGYRPQRGSHGTLEYDYNTDTWDFFTKHRVRYHYEQPPLQNQRVEYRLAFVEDTHGNRATLSYRQEKPYLLARVTDATGRSLEFGYDQFPKEPLLEFMRPPDLEQTNHRVTSVSGPMGLALTFGYDDYGNLVSATHNGGRTEAYDYTVNDPRDRHNLVRFTGPNNRVTGGDITTYAYYDDNDALPGEHADFQWGREIVQIPMKYELVKGVHESDAAWSFVYDFSTPGVQYRTKTTDGRGIDTRFTMNSQGNVTRQETAGKATVTRWAIDDGIDDVYVAARTDAAGRTTRYEYDANGNMKKETIVTSDFGEVVSEWRYDSKFSQLEWTSDPMGNETGHTLDTATGDILATDAPGTPPAHIGYAYDAKGRLTSTTDPLGFPTTYDAYDAYGNVTQTTDGLGNTTTYTYDERSRRRTMSDSFGRSATYDYNDLDQLTFEKRAVGQSTLPSADWSMTYTYMPGGQKLTETDGLGHTKTLGYDGRNQVVSESDSGEGLGYTATYGYDGNGNRTYEKDRNGNERILAYDDLNRLRSLTVGGTLAATYTPNDFDEIWTETDLHGHTTTYGYDGLYRRKTITIGQYTSTHLRDKNGNVTAEIDRNGNTTTRHFDGANRLESETNPLGHTITFTHDAAGNKLSVANSATGLTIAYDGYDALRRPGSVGKSFADPLTGQGVAYHTGFSYDDAAHVVETTVTTATGTVVTRDRYNGLDKPIERIVDDGGLNLTYQYGYDANGNQTAVKDPEGGDIDEAHVFDGLNRRVSSVYPLGLSETITYDGNGNVLSTTDERGIVTSHTYDEFDREKTTAVVESVSNRGAGMTVTSTTYSGSSRTVTDANGQSNTEVFDELHRTVKMTDPLGKESTVEYDGMYRTAVEDKRGVRTEFKYDAIGRQTAVIEFDENGTERSRWTTDYVDSEEDSANSQRTGRVMVHTDRRGTKRIVVLDALGRQRQVKVRHADLAVAYGAATFVVEQQEFDESDNRVARIDALGNRTEWTYDAAKRMTSMTEGAGGAGVEATTSFTYDGAGNVLAVKDGRQNGAEGDFTYGYDPLYRRTSQTNALGQPTSYGYDGAGNVTSVTDALGHETTYAYDEFNKLLKVVQGGAGGPATYYQYDSNRNLVAEQDASGNLTTYEYDALNRLTDSYRHRVAGTRGPDSVRSTAPGGDKATASHWHYGYDLANNETLIVDAEGQQVVKTFDYLNRMTSKTYAGAVEAGVEQPVQTLFEYDPAGSLTHVEEKKRKADGTEVSEVTVMQYDRVQRLTAKTGPDGKVVRYGYDRQGNETSVIDADGIITQYSYDARNRVTQAATEFGPGVGTTRFEYHPDSLAKAIRYPNGTTVETEYDAADRVTRVTNHAGDRSNPISRFDYSYDTVGNRLAAVEQVKGVAGGAAQTTSFGYDALNRLTSAAYPNGASVAYTYAPNGNRLTEVGTDPVALGPVNRRYLYNRLNELTLVSDEADGAQSVELRYDGNGNNVEQRTGVVSGSGVPSPSLVRYFTFDIRDQLVRTDAPGTGVTTFAYDFDGWRTRKTGALFDTRYIYGLQGLQQEYDAASGATTLKYNYGPSLLSLVAVGGASRTSYFYLQDALRSTVGLTDQAGAVRATYLYDAWGRLRHRADVTPNRRLFTGQYLDTETDLYYFGARYYDGIFGRFASRDPVAGMLSVPASRHPYLYALDNPLTYTDPDGRFVHVLLMGAAGALGGCVLGIVTDTGCGKGAVIGGVAGALAGLTFGATLAVTGVAGIGGELTAGAAAVSGWGVVGTTGSAAVAAVTSAAVGGAAGTTLDILTRDMPKENFSTFTGAASSLAASMSPRNVAAHSEEIRAYAGMAALTGAVSGAAGQFAAGAIRAASPLTTSLGRQFAADVVGDVAGQAVAVHVGAQDSIRLGQAMGGAAMSSIAGRTPRAIKEHGQTLMPMSGATARQQRIISAYAKMRGYEIGVRSADPVTALGTRALAAFTDLPAKPLDIKTKSTFGLVYDAKTQSYYRSDLDIAWVRDKNGRLLTNDQVMREVVPELNRRFQASGASTASIMHGSHLTAFEVEGFRGAAKLGAPSPVTLFGSRPANLRPAQVRDYVIRNQKDDFLWFKEWDKTTSFANWEGIPWLKFRLPKLDADEDRREKEK